MLATGKNGRKGTPPEFRSPGPRPSLARGVRNRDNSLAFMDFAPLPSMEEIRRERVKARQLRHSQWWKRKRSRGLCHYCGKRFPPHELTMDHLVPLARGGRSTKGNLVPACKACNTKKKALLAFEFDPER